VTGKKPRVLLTNDDGYQAAGLRALADELKEFADITIVAPSWERSGAAQSLTLRQPIVCHKINENEWAVDGTPADCVIVALHKLLPQKPDVVISGINHGANLGENVYYSGTVGAAREAAIHYVPGLAISLCSKRVDSNLRRHHIWPGEPPNSCCVKSFPNKFFSTSTCRKNGTAASS